MIFVSVGTFVKGFDELVAAMDAACVENGFSAFAQIGNSSIVPQHMAYTRFLSAEEMCHHLKSASLVVCHGGFGIIGDAMRAGKPIIAVPRRNAINTTDAPANNQVVVVERLREAYDITSCLELNNLSCVVRDALGSTNGSFVYNLRCNIPALIAGFLLDGNCEGGMS